MWLTSIRRVIAELGSLEYCFGNKSLPSDRSGSELKPTIGFRLQFNGHARFAVNKKVPSPPTGTKISAHSVSFDDSVSLNNRKKFKICSIDCISHQIRCRTKKKRAQLPVSHLHFNAMVFETGRNFFSELFMYSMIMNE